MKREEAKKVLDVIRSYYTAQASVTKNEYPKETIAGYSLADVSNACLHGSKALEQKDWKFYYDHGYAQAKRDLQEPCDDAISRAGAIKALEYDIFIEADDGLDNYRTVIEDLVNAIDNTQKAQIEALPSVTPQQRTGHWIEDENEMEVICSECAENNDKCSKFCPNCGAKMIESQESEE